MSQTISFLYCTMLLVIYGSVVTGAVCLHFMRKEELAIPIIGLFSFFLADNLIIFMTEQLPGFAEWYNQTFLQSPAIKSVIYLGIAYFSVRGWNTLMRKEISTLQIVSIILLGLWLFFVPLMGGGALESWLYYQGYQIFSIAAASYCLWRLRQRDTTLDESTLRWLRRLLVTVVVMYLIIVAEDTYVIFHVDNYSTPYIFNRSVSEDVFRLILIGFLFSRARKNFAPQDLPSEEQTLPEQAAPQVLTDADYMRLKYSQHMGLTRREEEILLLLLEDMNNQQIGEALHISLGTVKAHVHNVLQKADVTNRSELLRQFEIFSRESSDPPNC